MAKQTFTTGQVLTAAQMTSLQQTAMLGGQASAKTASYTLVAADAGTAISMSNASATTITVNTALFAAGDTVQITNLGVGVCTITAGTATVNTSASLALAQYESGTLDFTSTSAAIFIKGAGAAAASGGMTLISTTTLSGATTTVTFGTGYKDIMAVVYGMTNASASGVFRIAINGNSADGYFNYQENGSQGARSGGYYGTIGNPNRTQAGNMFVIKVYDYDSATLLKSVEVTGGMDLDGVGTRGSSNHGVQYQGNTPVTSLVFSNSGGNWSTGTVKLYGVN
jgi:hypothetical protein